MDTILEGIHNTTNIKITRIILCIVMMDMILESIYNTISIKITRIILFIVMMDMILESIQRYHYQYQDIKNDNIHSNDGHYTRRYSEYLVIKITRIIIYIVIMDMILESIQRYHYQYQDNKNNTIHSYNGHDTRKY